MDFGEDLDIDAAAQSVTSSVVEDSSLEPVIQSGIQSEMPEVAPDPVPAATKPPLVWELSDMAATAPLVTGNTLFESIMRGNPSAYSDLSQEISRTWRYNFDTILGPTNPAFVDATLSDQDIAHGLHSEYNPNGILWRVNAAGIPHPDDLDKYFEQQRVIESTNNRTVEEVEPLVNTSQDAGGALAGGVGDGTLMQRDSSASGPTNASEVKKPEVVLAASNAFFNSKVKLEASYFFTKFDRNKAVEYALKYADSPNPDYPNFGDNDCTNFVSQCWAYAGIPTSTDWFCTKIKKFYTGSWTDVEAFANYMEKEGYCYISYSSKDAKVGDVIQLYNDKDGWHHSAIITEIDEAGNIKYSGHSDPRNNFSLSEIYPQNGEQIRFICIYQRLCDYAPDISIA